MYFKDIIGQQEAKQRLVQEVVPKGAASWLWLWPTPVTFVVRTDREESLVAVVPHV